MAQMTAERFLDSLSQRRHASATISPWCLLANAIIEQAVKDYWATGKKLSQLREKAAEASAKGRKLSSKEQNRLEDAGREFRELEDFFRSEDFEILSGLDGAYLLFRLQEEATA